MVEGTGFENRQSQKLIEGSNPSLSARVEKAPFGSFFNTRTGFERRRRDGAESGSRKFSAENYA